MPSSTRGIVFQVDALDLRTLLGTVPYKVRKVPQRILALLLHFKRLLAALSQLLDGAVQVEHDVVLGSMQDFPDGPRDPVRVVVHVLHLAELC